MKPKDLRFVGTRFNVHGSLNVQPRTFLSGTRPVKMRASTCRRIIRDLLEIGYSNHGQYARNMWVVVEYCRIKGIAYTRRETTITLDDFVKPTESNHGNKEGDTNQGGNELVVQPVQRLQVVPTEVQAEAH